MSAFRTTEISDPRFESDNLRWITVKSEHLKGRGDICVFVPTGDFTNLPVAILLHGVYGSAWVWSQKGGAHRVAQNLIDKSKILPMVIAMPSDGLWGDGSAYLNHNEQHFEQWIVDDVPQAIIELIPEVSKQSKLCIGGLSMGGYGALRLGAKYSDRFVAVSAHSSITSWEQFKLFIDEDLTQYGSQKAEDQDVLESALKSKAQLPPIRFDCGTEDELINSNRRLHTDFTEHGIAHEYEEFPGGHSWAYWHEHIAKSLMFFSNQVNQYWQ